MATPQSCSRVIVIVINFVIVFGYGKPIVHTESEVFLQKGTKGLLTCEVEGQTDWVKWLRSQNEQTQTLVSFKFDIRSNTWMKDGKGFTEGSYDINSDFSLIIKNVQIDDDCTFVCTILTQEGFYSSNTKVHVFELPTERSTKQSVITIRTTSSPKVIQDTSNRKNVIIRVSVLAFVLGIATAVIGSLTLIWICRCRNTRQNDSDGHTYTAAPMSDMSDMSDMSEARCEDEVALLTPDEVKLYRRALTQFYRDVFSEIKTSPLESKSLKNFEQIYVHLSLVVDDNKRKPITYDKVIKYITDETHKGRVAVFGEAGVGKTTLLSKMAYDWANRKHLRGIELLFFIPLREVQSHACFGDIPKEYVPKVNRIDSKKLTNYIRENQSKVMLLLDGIDEYTGDIQQTDSADALVKVLRGEDFVQSPVIISTRPWRAEQIAGGNHIHDTYVHVIVEGFKKENVKFYIEKFFEDDSSHSADGLIHLMTMDSLVAENMAPYPIFCCMLCHIWKEESGRKAIQKLQTFSQLFDEMIDSLMKQWQSKNEFRNYFKRGLGNLLEIGKVAFDGLLNSKLIFTPADFQRSPNSLIVGCEIGVLSSKSLKQTDKSVSFSHKLFQEYLAGNYFASVYSSNPSNCRTYLENDVIPRWKEFRYLLYFSAAHCKNYGHAGRDLLKILCKQVDDLSFLVDVALECQDESPVFPVTEIFNEKATVIFCETPIPVVGAVNLNSKHTKLGLLYALDACCRNFINKNPEMSKHLGSEKGINEPTHNSAVGLSTLSNLQTLEMYGVEFDEFFYRGMSTAARYSKIKDVKLGGMGISKATLGSFLTLPLQSLTLHDITRCEKGNIQEGSTSVKIPANETVTELSVDYKSVQVLCELGLPAACPKVKTLKLTCSETVGSDVIKTVCSPYLQLEIFQVEGCSPYPSIQDSMSFCGALSSFCPQLIELSLFKLHLGNDMVRDILWDIPVHIRLNSIKIHQCDTDDTLDAFLKEKRNMRIDVDHGRPHQ